MSEENKNQHQKEVVNTNLCMIHNNVQIKMSSAFKGDKDEILHYVKFLFMGGSGGCMVSLSVGEKIKEGAIGNVLLQLKPTETTKKGKVNVAYVIDTILDFTPNKV